MTISRLQIAIIPKNLAQYLMKIRYRAASVPQIDLKSASLTLAKTFIHPKKPGLLVYPIITGFIIEPFFSPKDFSIKLFLLSIIKSLRSQLLTFLLNLFLL
jgi:hypothetical protein